MGDIEEDYTEERLADYDRVAIDQHDVLVMGFITLVRQLRAEIAAERAWRKLALDALHSFGIHDAEQELRNALGSRDRMKRVWWVMHNAVAHPLMVVWPRAGEWLHEWTGRRM
jgi:hypothetical protein